MTTQLSGTLVLSRSVLSEVVEDPNITPRVVVSGTAPSVQGPMQGQGKMDDISQSGEFRAYGNGNTRLVLGTATARTNTFALMAITAGDVATVQALLGHTVCYRDTYGRKVFGAFLDMQVSYIPLSGGLANVGLVIQSTTYDEAV